MILLGVLYYKIKYICHFLISLICTMIDDCATEHDYDYNDQILDINS